MTDEDCSLVFTTSRGQVKIAPTVPPHLEGSRLRVEDERVEVKQSGGKGQRDKKNNVYKC